MTYEKTKLYDAEYRANFLTPFPGLIVPLPSVQDLSETQNYINEDEARREFKAFFVQDIWDITDDLRLTISARYDDYSDFGGSFNPRAGLTWQFAEGLDLKLIYGRAFRAPTFQELYFQNNPGIIGSPDLEPETVDTYEISLGSELKAFSTRITGFHTTIKDSINTIKLETGSSYYVFQNTDKLRSRGFELEMKYDFGKGTYLAMNYTYQDAENQDTEERLTGPGHVGNVMANIRLSEYFNFYTDFHFQKDCPRATGDDREAPPDFGIVNTTLIAEDFLKGLEIRGSVYNLLDKEYVSPLAAGTLPGDLPMPGRSFVVELRYEF
ncbi:TonB-dependent receptor [Desulfococcaceae bacterium HSG8]|nr:TonB-dependent receptor [Desulfococcaceae bacterium HSG8]